MIDTNEPADDAEPPQDAEPLDVSPMTDSPSGIRRAAADGMKLIDAMAGRSSVFGFGFDPLTDAIQIAAQGYLGDAAALLDHPTDGDDLLLRQFQELFTDSGGVSAESIFVCSSADMAVEAAIALARGWKSHSAYRTITLVGSDHGRSGVCRTAGGRPELHEGYGPMMAGFSHVPAGDIDALRATIDEQTACILLSPIDLQNSAQSLDADYLIAVRELCDEFEILLIFDESRLCFASSGKPLAFSSIAEIQADAVILSGGLFARAARRNRHRVSSCDG